ncbi:MAG: hypothetical protein AAAB13_20720 [Pseudomonas sp.]
MEQPSERAMKAAVEMELHAACGTMTIAKGRAIDAVFPAYDDVLNALITALPYVEEAEPDQAYAKGAVRKVIDQMRAAISKATA